MDKTLKRVFFWTSFLVGCFFIWWSDRTLTASSAMVAFATGAIFLIVACVVALTSDIFFKYHNTQEDISSVPASVPVLLLAHDKVTEEGVPLSHRDMSTGGGSLFVLESANCEILDKVFADADLDGARLDAAISEWQELPISRTGKGA